MRPRPGPVARVLVVLLMHALCVCARPDSDKLHALLRSAPLAPDKHQQDLSLLSSLLLSELLSLENDSVQDPDSESLHVNSEGVHVDPAGVHVDPEGVHVQRDAFLLAPRERKADVKLLLENFHVLLMFTCQHLPAPVSSCQLLSAPVSSCQLLSAPVSSCQHLSAPVSSCQLLSAPVSSCQLLSAPVSPYRSTFPGQSVRLSWSLVEVEKRLQEAECESTRPREEHQAWPETQRLIVASLLPSIDPLYWGLKECFLACLLELNSGSLTAQCVTLDPTYKSVSMATNESSPREGRGHEERKQGERGQGERRRGDERGDEERGDKERGDKERGDKERGDKERVDEERGDKERVDEERGDKERGDKERGDEEMREETRREETRREETRREGTRREETRRE
ncbi:hypothetical protein WMY93_031837 [Mugilogobius chulae]|uniref:Uncharacterized protein n=1 Tax=Mugilogobius chulae TaxID=88201 RepID=A0AAW0MF98_9GOBI